MRVDINPARRDQQAFCAYGSFGLLSYFANFNHKAVFDRNICRQRGFASTVYNCSAAND
jgi:hypothetical protein